MYKVEPMIMTENDKINFDKARNCHIREKPLKGDKVRDHCHISGKYRGPAHDKCNINYRYPKTIPVVFHNLRGCDSHLIMQHIGKFDDKISCIPNNMEKYISFSLGKLVFIDSLQFMNSSLGSLVDNLKQSGIDKFKHLKSEFNDDNKMELLTRKGVYPYDYLDDFDKFYDIQLPSKSAFYSKLCDENISDDDYKHAKKSMESIW